MRFATHGAMTATQVVPAALPSPPRISAPLPTDSHGLGSVDTGAELVVKRGPNAGSRFRLDKPVMSAGRDPSCDIFLDDVATSRRHAEFRLRNGKHRVIDTNSLNGTSVNHRSVEATELTDGDEIRLGKFCLVFLADPRSG